MKFPIDREEAKKLIRANLDNLTEEELGHILNHCGIEHYHIEKESPYKDLDDKLMGKPTLSKPSEKCCCGEIDLEIGTAKEVDNVVHRKNNPCYIINQALSKPSVVSVTAIEKEIENHITTWIVAGGILTDVKGLAIKIHNLITKEL